MERPVRPERSAVGAARRSGRGGHRQIV